MKRPKDMNYEKMLCIYSKERPDYLDEFRNVEPFLRLRYVGMNCGLEYTSFPFFKDIENYSRYMHSLGVAIILYHFTKDIRQVLSGLYHDIATPCFSHVVDFLNGDHEKQESTEEKTHAIIQNDRTIQSLLEKYHLKTEDIDDYHRYPIADNDTPKLSSDRLEYHLGNLVQFHHISYERIATIYNDILILRNEDGDEELGFKHIDIAVDFTLLSLKNSHVYVANEDRYSMEYLARLLKSFIEKGYLQKEDLYQDENFLIHKIENHPLANKEWLTFISLSQILESDKPKEGYLHIPSKKRYVNPYVLNQGRVLSLSKEAKEANEEFLALSFDHYLSGY